MGKRDPRVDAYIEQAADFAKPILIEIRERVHAACPEVEEAIKWGSPSFMYRGPLCGMDAFKEHCVYGYWKGPLVVGGDPKGSKAYRLRLEKVSDLGSRRAMAADIKKAMALNEEGVSVPRARRARATPVVLPAALADALQANKKAQAAFEKLSPSHQREYAEWIEQARRDETRARRLETAIQQISEGKPQNWKYMK